MTNPIVSDNKPVKVELNKDAEYHFCVCGHNHLNQFAKDDLATWHREMALLSGVKYSGFASIADK